MTSHVRSALWTLLLFHQKGEGADYAHYNSTCPRRFWDLPTTLIFDCEIKKGGFLNLCIWQEVDSKVENFLICTGLLFFNNLAISKGFYMYVDFPSRYKSALSAKNIHTLVYRI